MNTFERVKLLSEKRGLSIVELEEKLGFGRNSLYSWKTKTPNGTNLLKVAEFFNVSTDYLLGRETPGIDDRSQLIAAHIDDDVSDEQMKEILQFIEFIKTKHNM